MQGGGGEGGGGQFSVLGADYTEIRKSPLHPVPL